MTEGSFKEQPDEPENGVTVGGESQYKRVLWIPPGSRLPATPSPIETDVDTQPLQVVGTAHFINSDDELDAVTDYQLMRRRFRNGISNDGQYYRTRRHWREPMLRLLRPQSEKSFGKQFDKWQQKRKENPSRRPPQKYGPLWYVVSVYGAIIAIIVSITLLNWPEYQSGATLVLLVSVLLLTYSFAREQHRWQNRTVLVRDTETGLRVTYGEPDNLFFGFNGNINGHVRILEGSTELTPLISWPNKLIFHGCGDLDISSKVESGGSPLLENIPRVRRLHAFVSRV